MRKFLFCLLIALTAFRGFVGDAMAVEMVSSHTPAQQQAAQEISVIHTAPQAMPCHGAGTGNSELADESEAGNESNDSCLACQVCHLNVAVTVYSTPRLGLLAADTPQTASRLWHSAALAQATKPPIS